MASVTIDIEPDGDGIIEVEGNAPDSYPDTIDVTFGTRLHVEAIAEPGYHFVEWSGHLSGSENPTSLRVISTGTRIKAHFLPNVSEFTSEDEVLNVTIPKGTVALDEDGGPLIDLEFIVEETPPSLPSGANLIGLAYDIEPGGATFDHEVTLSWSYDPADIPAGVAEEDLVVACYDETAGEWSELPSEVDKADNIVTAFVEHFSIFAILGFAVPPSPPIPATFTISSLSVSPLDVSVGEAASISVLAANTGEEAGSCMVTLKINEVVTETKEITLAGGASETVTFSVSQDEADTYLVDVNGLIGSFVAQESALVSLSSEAIAPPTPPPASSSEAIALPTPPPASSSGAIAPPTPPPASSSGAIAPPAPPPASSSGVNWAIIAPIICGVFLAIFLVARLRRRGDWD
jgi:hypothetical protein